MVADRVLYLTSINSVYLVAGLTGFEFYYIRIR